MTPDDLLTIDDAAALTGFSARSLRRWCKDQRIRARQGQYRGEWRVTVRALLAAGLLEPEAVTTVSAVRHAPSEDHGA